MISPIALPFFLWLFVIIIILLLWWAAKYRGKEITKERLARDRFVPKFERYTRRESGGQWETDLRLTYKRFKDLYPYSKITYQEYKRLQAQKAFKRAVGSEKIKRMVR